MASPENEVKIDRWIQGNVEGSAADLAAVRAQLITWATNAERGDQQAQQRLAGLEGGGIVVTPSSGLTAPVFTDGAPEPEAPDDGFGGLFPAIRDFFMGPPQPPAPQPTAVPTLPISGTDRVWAVGPGGELIGSPIAGAEDGAGQGLSFPEGDPRTLQIAIRQARQRADQLDAAGDWRRADEEREFASSLQRNLESMLQNLGAGEVGGDGFVDKTLRDLQFAAQRAEAAGNPELAAQYRSRMQQLLLGTGTGGGMTAFQSGQLDISRQRLGLDREQAAIQAARAGNPLAYLGLTTQATPQEALSLIAPAPSQVTIQRGDPLGRPALSGALRLPGVQAQSRETPLERAARQERQGVEFGLQPEESAFFEERLRRGAGPRLPRAGFGGSIR